MRDRFTISSHFIAYANHRTAQNITIRDQILSYFIWKGHEASPSMHLAPVPHSQNVTLRLLSSQEIVYTVFIQYEAYFVLNWMLFQPILLIIRHLTTISSDQKVATASIFHIVRSLVHDTWFLSLSHSYFPATSFATQCWVLFLLHFLHYPKQIPTEFLVLKTWDDICNRSKYPDSNPKAIQFGCGIRFFELLNTFLLFMLSSIKLAPIFYQPHSTHA